MQKHLEQLHNFKNHLNNTFNDLMGDDATPESVNEFYNSDFIITFRGQRVTLRNGADIFQGIEELIEVELENCEEFINE